jgi:hypothetical protein
MIDSCGGMKDTGMSLAITYSKPMGSSLNIFLPGLAGKESKWATKTE